jgi:hypothetical protein
MTTRDGVMPPVMRAGDFDALYQRLQRTVAWGPADRRGALNHITPTHILTAASEIRLGRTAPLGAAIETEVTLDNPDPSVHQMTSPAGDEADRAGLSFAMDRLAMNIHGNADSHIDALCHVIYRALLYNNVPADSITASGASELSSTWPAAGSSAAASSSMFPGCPAGLGSNQANTYLRTTSGGPRRPNMSPLARATCCSCASAIAIAGLCSARGMQRVPGPDSTPLHWSSWSNDGWQCWAATATTTLRRASLTVSTSRCMYSRSTRSGCICSTTCNFTISCRYASKRAVGLFSV